MGNTLSFTIMVYILIDLLLKQRRRIISESDRDSYSKKDAKAQKHWRRLDRDPLQWAMRMDIGLEPKYGFKICNTELTNRQWNIGAYVAAITLDAPRQW